MPFVPDPLAEVVIGGAIEVHKALGPGLLESAYERCLSHELALRHVASTRQISVPVEFKGVHLDCGYRVDLIVEGTLVVELKAVDRLLPIHQAQLLTYLKLLNMKRGLLINFNTPRLVDGVKSLLL